MTKWEKNIALFPLLLYTCIVRSERRGCVEFVTSIQKASEWGVTKRMVNYWCSLGKIDGAVKDGIRWKIPMDAERPDRYGQSPVLIDYVVRIEGKTVSVGNQSFESIRENDSFYVDKTSFIEQWWESSDAVTLITRPRRFGKTLNLSMMECFFSPVYYGRTELFEGLKIWEREKYRNLQGTYPVLFLSLAGVKNDNYEGAVRSIRFEVSDLCRRIKHNLNLEKLSRDDRNIIESMSADISEDEILTAIKLLSGILSRYYGKKVIILLDEYDTPMIEAYFCGYWDKMSKFMRMFFNNALKTNPYIEKALLTGITRVSKESMFSDMNNLYVASITKHRYETAFGFTEAEVFAALEHVNLGKYKKRVKQWYDGFVIGRCSDIYNPWSITRFIDSGGEFDTYWANTSSNVLVSSLISKGSRTLKCSMEDLMNGIPVEAVIDENIDFASLEYEDAAVWGLLYTTGYLKADSVHDDVYTLSLTNVEINKMFARMFRKWFARTSGNFGDFQKALIKGDIEEMNYYMNMVTTMTFSYFDCGMGYGIIDETERFYHGFVLGLIAQLSDDFYITSNRESGIGRYDIMMESKDREKDSYIIEFKVFDSRKDKSLEECAARALEQIECKEYDKALVARQIEAYKIRKYGFAFEGKRVLIKGV